MPCSTRFKVSDFTPSASKFRDPKPLIISGLSTIFIWSENTCLFILSLRNYVPLAMAEDDIALANAFKIFLAILLSKIILNFSLPILSGPSFLIV